MRTRPRDLDDITHRDSDHMLDASANDVGEGRRRIHDANLVPQDPHALIAIANFEVQPGRSGLLDEHGRVPTTMLGSLGTVEIFVIRCGT